MDAGIDVEFSLQHDAVNALIANDMAMRVGPGVDRHARCASSNCGMPRVIRGTVVLRCHYCSEMGRQDRQDSPRVA